MDNSPLDIIKEDGLALHKLKDTLHSFTSFRSCYKDFIKTFNFDKSKVNIKQIKDITFNNDFVLSVVRKDGVKEAIYVNEIDGAMMMCLKDYEYYLMGKVTMIKELIKKRKKGNDIEDYDSNNTAKNNTKNCDINYTKNDGNTIIGNNNSEDNYAKKSKWGNTNLNNSTDNEDGNISESKKVTFGHTTIHNTPIKSSKDTTTLSNKYFDDVSDDYSITEENRESEESGNIKESIKFLDEVYKKNEEDYFDYPGSVED